MAVHLYSLGQFQDFIKTKSRHVLNKSNNSLLAVILETSKQRAVKVPQGTHFWRAQVAHVEDRKETSPGQVVVFNRPAPIERMIPRRDRAREGRVNAKGIPVLYCATTLQTGIAEVRPWVGAIVTVATLSTKLPLTLVDCSEKLNSVGLRDIKTQEDAMHNLWASLNNGFSEPVTTSDDTADYAATQFIADAFRQAGFHGIKYRSRVGDSSNVALFNLDYVEIVERYLHYVESITVKSTPITWGKENW